MLFSSTTFLFLFLPLVLIFLFPLPRRVQNIAILGFSIAFYIWGTGSEVLWIFLAAVVSWVAGLLIPTGKFFSSRYFLAIVISALLLPLLVVKYVPAVNGWWGLESPFALVIPLGISFFTFHAISYVVDVRSSRISPERKITDYFLYLFYFPHQIAGPIVRYGEIFEDIKFRTPPNIPDVSYGLARFGWGLAKKAIIADPAGNIATVAWTSASGSGTLSFLEAWIAAVAFTIQIYFDFSAYTDMAVGLARVFGFHFPENFNLPYASVSAGDFWKRWHMSLSRWFRDYVYIPMGGNRKGIRREFLALIATFALTSIWHGATFPYLIWGGIWSLALVAERIIGVKRWTRFVGLRRAFMLLFIIFSWVPFRAISVDQALEVWSSMLSPSKGLPSVELMLQMTPIGIFSLTVGVVYIFLTWGVRRRCFEIAIGEGKQSKSQMRVIIIGILSLLLGITFTMWSTSNPFIYFQF